jgi:hypothetical protein
MSLPSIFSPPPGDAGWGEYWFAHFQDHLDIVQAIQKTGIPLTVYMIDPWLDGDKDGILDRHQQFHNDMNAVLATPGQDLSELDTKDPAKVAEWVYLQYQEHLNAHIALNI